MSSRRFYIAAPPANEKALVTGSEAHHLIHVLRAKPGQSIELLDGSGQVWQGEISAMAEGQVEVEHLRLLPAGTKQAIPILLVQALAKADKLEWILQKTTELGVTEIFLLETQHSVLKIPSDRISSKMQRWEKIILAAAKQSRRATLPVLHSPLKCPEAIGLIQADLKLFFSENEKQQQLKPLLRGTKYHSAACCVGPEGGWSAEEEQLFLNAGFIPVSLGENILRTETAALVGISLLRYETEL
jgi:16S rRNA (uracil1498-N3)-methyltransferase